MNITSAQYVNDEEGNQSNMLKCVIDGATIFVPMSTGNRHYQAVQEWVADGNTIADAD
jgi:hypothetical protein